MKDIKLTTKQRQAIVSELQGYFADELESDLGQFDGEFLLDFVIKTIAPTFYNQGVRDAQLVFERKMLDVSDELYEIEKISKF